MRISDWSSDVCSSDRRNCFRKRTSFSENSRRSDTWYFRLVIRSIPIPNAKPEKNCGSTPHFSSTFGSTIPQPRISPQPVCLQIVQPAPLQIRSEERRGGKECVRTGRSGGGRYH